MFVSENHRLGFSFDCFSLTVHHESGRSSAMDVLASFVQRIIANSELVLRTITLGSPSPDTPANRRRLVIGTGGLAAGDATTKIVSCKAGLFTERSVEIVRGDEAKALESLRINFRAVGILTQCDT